MGGVLFQYGTAVHLAFLTVAPLFLHAVCGPSAHAVVLLWLSVFGLTWIVMNPSPRVGEWPRDARHRIGWEMAHDPFLTFCGIALLVSAVRAVNGGVSSAYDAASGLWSLKGPFASLLPGSVTGSGLLPLAGFLGLTVVTLGVRHALGGRARFAYVFLSGTLAALAAVCWRLLAMSGVTVRHLAIRVEDPFYLGSLLGVFFLFAIISWIESWPSEKAVAEVVSALSASVLLAGMLFYAPTFSLWIFGLVGLATACAGVVLHASGRSPAAWLRTAFSLGIVLAPVALLVAGEIARPALWPLFGEGFLTVREVASSVALDAWREATRMGQGLGSYPLALGFFAKPEDWQVLSSVQSAAPNGWIHVLLERGLLGAVFVLFGLGLLLRDGILRYVRAGADWSPGALHFVGVAALLSVTAVTFVECSYTQVEALMPVGAALGLTAASFPEPSEADHG